jgi:hypothetical protein
MPKRKEDLQDYLVRWGAKAVPFSDAMGSPIFPTPDSEEALVLLDETVALRATMVLYGDNGVGIGRIGMSGGDRCRNGLMPYLDDAARGRERHRIEFGVAHPGADARGASGKQRVISQQDETRRERRLGVTLCKHGDQLGADARGFPRRDRQRRPLHGSHRVTAVVLPVPRRQRIQP